MTSTARRRASAPRKKQASGQHHDDVVPVIPGWASDWGPALLVPGGLVLLAALAAGIRDGAPWGWALLLAVTAVVVAGWARGYLRRLRKRQERLDRALCEQSEFPLVDAMTGDEFEVYCEKLLPSLGYKNIQGIGGAGDDGVDILATDEAGDDVGIQCKRRKHPVGPWAVHAVRGAVAGGRHARLKPVLMTNARVTDRGWEAAAERNVKVIAREQLGYAMWQVRNNAVRSAPDPGGQSHTVSDTGVPGARQRVPPGTALTLGVVFCAAVTVLVVVIRTLAVGPRPTAETPRAAAATPAAASSTPAGHAPQPGPVQVIRDYYAAISGHDWPLVWRLGGRNLGQGPYATYQGMVSGYQGTIRDVLTEVHATGNTVTGRFLAHQAGDVTRPYTFTFVVRNGVIVSGHTQ